MNRGFRFVPIAWTKSAMKACWLAALVLLCCSAALAEPDLHSLTDAVDARYNHLHTLEAQFTETYSGSGATRTESGTLLLKKPGRMRWDYTEPRPKMFLADGNTAWFYVPGENQVRRMPVKQLDDLRSPLRYLLGKTKLEKEFDDLHIALNEKPVNSGDIVLEGIPKGLRERVARTLLEVTPSGYIQRIVVEELDGSVTEFRFLQQHENVEIPDAKFHFTPPQGVEIVSGTLE
jgi:outer membrane lipoprotein carrier protein